MKNKFYYFTDNVEEGWYYEEYSKGEWSHLINAKGNSKFLKPVDRDKLEKGKIRLWYFCIDDLNQIELFPNEMITAFSSGEKRDTSEEKITLQMKVYDNKETCLDFVGEPIARLGQRIKIYDRFFDRAYNEKLYFDGYIENLKEFVDLYYKKLNLK